MSETRYALVVRCPDRRGIVAAVSTFLAKQGGSITESSQCDEDGQFFMRVVIAPDGKGGLPPIDKMKAAFADIADEFRMDWQLQDLAVKARILILVSRFGHCLHDLLHRWRAGMLPVDVVGVVSNHEDMRSFTEWNGLPFHHCPIAKGEKAQQEAQIRELAKRERVDLVVLARYMQILSPDFCAALAGRCINIHHSFLPSFKGAKPYHQAHARGVKIIGATAHYVTTDLDEGPIIEQGTHRVNHGHSPEQFVEVGQDIECTVLARAVKWHVEHRVIVNGHKTIVFA